MSVFFLLLLFSHIWYLIITDWNCDCVKNLNNRNKILKLKTDRHNTIYKIDQYLRKRREKNEK